MEKMRVFVAIDFPPEVKKQIGQVVTELKKKYPQIRWEREENLHLTLKFLGWIETKLKTTTQNSKLDQIIAGAEGAAKEIKPFWFRPTKIGYFLKESLIVWLGAESQEGLTKLVKNLEREMKLLGFPREKREFSPHITLGRLRHAHPLSRWRQIAQEISQFGVPVFEKFKVAEIVLMESKLTPQGAVYKPLKTIKLDKDSSQESIIRKEGR